MAARRPVTHPALVAAYAAALAASVVLGGWNALAGNWHCLPANALAFAAFLALVARS